jgi:hypothetical protein
MFQNKTVWPGHHEERKDLERNKKKGRRVGNYLFDPYKNGNDARRRKWIFFGFKNI